MLPVSSAYFEPRVCASNRWACSPAQASLSVALASAGLSLSSAAAAVSPVASAAKNFCAVGSGPFGFGVHALSDATTTATVTRLAARVAVESHVAIEADVKKLPLVFGEAHRHRTVTIEKETRCHCGLHRPPGPDPCRWCAPTARGRRRGNPWCPSGRRRRDRSGWADHRRSHP